MNDIFRLAAVGLTGAILAVIIKNTRPEYAFLVSLATGVLLFGFSAEALGEIFSAFSAIAEKSGIDGQYIKVVFKICASAYLTQFACELCRDAGENAIALKIELAGKLCILIITLPILSAFFGIITEILNTV